MTKQKIILDTDIGDDIDDALALALICASPELDLVGVTTVFGNVEARSRQARTVLKLAGPEFDKVPVAAGCGAPLASRPMTYHGTEGYLTNRVPGQDRTCLPEAELAPLEARHGVQFLIDTIMGGDGDIVPVMIGALTNLAVALTMERRLVAKIPRLCIMAGEIHENMAEWNILCDPEAAALVFDSGIPIDLVPYSIGAQCQLLDEHMARFEAGALSVTRYLKEAIAVWQHGNERRPMLFDPLAVMTLLRPPYMQWRRGTVKIELRGETTYAYTTFTDGEAGPHNVVSAIDKDAAMEAVLDRLAPHTG